MTTPDIPTDWHLERDAHGRLRLTLADGTLHEGVVPVRAFPIDAPDEGISLLGSDGHERVWIERLDALPAATQALLESELTQRDFVPVIERLVGVSTFSTPSTWTVDTDRGRTAFVLKAEEDIRRVHSGGLLVTDSHGVVYRVRELTALDRGSRRLLDRFL